MIRIFTAGLMVLMASNVEAIPVGDIYKFCKNYDDNGFEYEEPTDAICIAYFSGIRDMGVSVCRELESTINSEALDAYGQGKRAFSTVQKFFGVGELGDMTPAIQYYVNKIKNEPEWWEYRADLAVLESLQVMAPCE